MSDRSVVKNAADPRQVRAAARLEAKDRDLEIDDLRSVLRTEFGRRFIWRLMGHCKTFGSVFAIEPTLAAYNSGRQDVGHMLIAEVNEADASKLLLMMQESVARERLRNNEVDATHTESAGSAATQEKSDAH